jgi:hypothetical protein
MNDADNKTEDNTPILETQPSTQNLQPPKRTMAQVVKDSNRRNRSRKSMAQAFKDRNRPASQNSSTPPNRSNNPVALCRKEDDIHSLPVGRSGWKDTQTDQTNRDNSRSRSKSRSTKENSDIADIRKENESLKQKMDDFRERQKWLEQCLSKINDQINDLAAMQKQMHSTQGKIISQLEKIASKMNNKNQSSSRNNEY